MHLYILSIALIFFLFNLHTHLDTEYSTEKAGRLTYFFGIASLFIVAAIVWNLSSKRRRVKFLNKSEDQGYFRYLKIKYGEDHEDLQNLRNSEKPQSLREHITRLLVTLFPAVGFGVVIYVWIK